MVQSRQLASILVGADRATCGTLGVDNMARSCGAVVSGRHFVPLLQFRRRWTASNQRALGTQDGRMHRSRTGCAPRPFAQRSVAGWDWPLFVHLFSLV